MVDDLKHITSILVNYLPFGDVEDCEYPLQEPVGTLIHDVEGRRYIKISETVCRVAEQHEMGRWECTRSELVPPCLWTSIHWQFDNGRNARFCIELLAILIRPVVVASEKPMAPRRQVPNHRLALGIRECKKRIVSP